MEISWLPDEDNFGGIFEDRMPLFHIVRGKNYTLKETHDIAAQFGYGVCRYGPYVSTPELFERAKIQLAHLNSGKVRYKMLDWGFSRWATNCIHAVAGVLGRLETFIRRGPGASREVARYFHKRGHIPVMKVEESAAHGLLGEAAEFPPGP